MNLTKEQIEAVVQWMNTWSNLQQSAIPQMFREAFTPKENTENSKEIKIGDTVRLKNDSNSPTMIVTMDASSKNSKQSGLNALGSSWRENTIMADGTFECSYFVAYVGNENYKRLYKERFHKDALEKLISTK